jgi:hypothetical protein
MTTTTVPPRHAICAYTTTGEFAGWYTGEGIGALTYNMARAAYYPSEKSAEDTIAGRKLETAAGWKAYLWVVEPLPVMLTYSGDDQRAAPWRDHHGDRAIDKPQHTGIKSTSITGPSKHAPAEVGSTAGNRAKPGDSDMVMKNKVKAAAGHEGQAGIDEGPAHPGPQGSEDRGTGQGACGQGCEEGSGGRGWWGSGRSESGSGQ